MKEPNHREHKVQPSLISYALRLAIPIGIVVLLTTWFVENHLLQSIVETELRKHIKDTSERETAKIGQNLQVLREFAQSLAVNDLIVNSLIDLEGRDAYIPVFFNSLIAPHAADASVSLVDYTGRGIASSNRDNSMPPVSPDMVSQGSFFIDSHRLLIVEPILISGYAEGAIVLSYATSTFDELFGKPAYPYTLFVTGYNGLVVYSTNSDFARVGTLDIDKPVKGWLQVRSPIPKSNLLLVISSSNSKAFEFMETFQLVQIVGLAILLAANICVVLLTIFIVSRPLKRFTSVISSIKRVGDLNKRLETKGPREIAEIATTINRMGDWLESTTVSSDYMDNVLASVTEGIITIDHKDLITSFNAGACQMFGYQSNDVLGQNVAILLPQGERQALDSYLQNTTLHAPRIIGQSRDLEGCRKDGSLFPIELVVSPLLVEDDYPSFVGTIRDITERKLIEENLEQRSLELKRINQELEHLALTDVLTGLGNRNLFNDRLSNLIKTSKRTRTPFSLLMMDLNKFKEVNDTHGHEAGDIVLAEIGRRLASLSRDADSFFRLGGDEFSALITTGVTQEGLAILTERITNTIKMPIDYNFISLEIGISIGIAIYPEHSEDEDELIRLSDVAMYEAKHG